MSDLLDIAKRAAAMAEGDEQVEAYVVRTRETDVEVFDGDVESLSVALETALAPATRSRATAVAGMIRTDGATVGARLLSAARAGGGFGSALC